MTTIILSNISLTLMNTKSNMATAFSHIIHFSENPEELSGLNVFNNWAEVGINKPKTICGMWFWHVYNTFGNPILTISWEHHIPQLKTQEPWHYHVYLALDKCSGYGRWIITTHQEQLISFIHMSWGASPESGT